MNTKYFDMAKEASLKSTYKVKVGCVVVCGKEVYSGWNKGNKTHTKSTNEWNTIHAEFDCIKKAGGWRNKKLKKADMYIYRSTKATPALSKPCLDCMGLIASAGIKNVYFTGPNGYEKC